MNKVIVTGANGFIGSALCRELVHNGTEVIAVLRSWDSDISRIKDLKGIQTVYCDMSEYSRLPDIIHDNGIDVMFHFAWAGSSGKSRGDERTQLDNIKYTCDAVKACKDIGCKRFVYAGSIMEYEISAIMNYDRIPVMNTLYASAKLAADYFARTIASNLGIKYIRTVISNIYGPGETSPRLINTSIRKMLDGENCSFSSGNQMYDFIYITDAVKEFVALGDKGKANKTYYIGSLNPRPLKYFLEKMYDVIAPNAKRGIGAIPFDGVSLTYKEFDIEAIKKDTEIVPTISFEEGIKRTASWIRGGRSFAGCEIFDLKNYTNKRHLLYA